jgi:hypothetical protein
MLSDDLDADLEQLFEDCGAAHHEAFSEVGGEDTDWPLWYAEWLHPKLVDLLDAEFTRSELVYLLVLAENERQSHAPGSRWSGYYGQFFADRYLP